MKGITTIAGEPTLRLSWAQTKVLPMLARQLAVQSRDLRRPSASWSVSPVFRMEGYLMGVRTLFHHLGSRAPSRLLRSNLRFAGFESFGKDRAKVRVAGTTTTNGRSLTDFRTEFSSGNPRCHLSKDAESWRRSARILPPCNAGVTPRTRFPDDIRHMQRRNARARPWLPCRRAKSTAESGQQR